MQPGRGWLRESTQAPIARPRAGDGGAHMMSICDASMPTHLLTYWTRDRTEGARLPLANAVHMFAQKNAEYIGLHDRGVLAPGYRADVNVIDYERLRLHSPRAVSDLPAGGSRLDQPIQLLRVVLEHLAHNRLADLSFRRPVARHLVRAQFH